MSPAAVAPWGLFLLTLAAAYPWSVWLVSRLAGGRLLAALLALGLGSGALTLLMFWQALLGVHLTAAGVAAPYLLLMAPGWALCWRSRLRLLLARPDWSRPEVWAAGLIGLVAAAVLVNAVCWPFYREDALAIYHRYGDIIYQTGALVPFAGRDEAFYQAYPIHLSLLYAYAYQISGWPNEYLARAAAALLSLGCLPAAYCLGREVYGRRAGWLAALLLGLMPTFGRWASSGYADLPMAFYYTLAALFTTRLWRSRRAWDALLAGLMLGLAAWTKNAALVGVGLFGLTLAVGWAMRRVPARRALLTLAACAAVAAPWYLRNWVEAGLIMPPTAWTEQAQRTLSTLFIFITQPQDYSLPGWGIVIGAGAIVVQFIRRRAVENGLLLAWSLPFFAVWWSLASYDPRFILMFLPLLAAAGAGGLDALIGLANPRWQARLTLPLAALGLALAINAAWVSVDHKAAILRAPFMDDAARRAIVLGGE